jgi:hypothetical protein
VNETLPALSSNTSFCISRPVALLTRTVNGEGVISTSSAPARAITRLSIVRRLITGFLISRLRSDGLGGNTAPTGFSVTRTVCAPALDTVRSAAFPPRVMSAARRSGAEITVPSSAVSGNITVREPTIIDLSSSLRVDLILRGMAGKGTLQLPTG